MNPKIGVDVFGLNIMVTSAVKFTNAVLARCGPTLTLEKLEYYEKLVLGRREEAPPKHLPLHVTRLALELTSQQKTPVERTQPVFL